jgi:hypothetical protein
MLNNYSKDPAVPFIATVVGFEDQKEQVTGFGWGWRCKIAMHTFASSSAEISDKDFEYGIILAGNSDGTGAANHRRSSRIRQGDTVVGFKYGGKRGMSLIFGALPRTRNTVFGKGRFDTKSAYFGADQPKDLFGSDQEFSENSGHDIPVDKPRCSKIDKTVPAKKKEDLFSTFNLGDTTNKIGQFLKPPKVISRLSGLF